MIFAIITIWFLLLLVQNFSLFYSIYTGHVSLMEFYFNFKLISKVLQSGTTSAFGLSIIMLVITITCMWSIFRLIKAHNQVPHLQLITSKVKENHYKILYMKKRFQFERSSCFLFFLSWISWIPNNIHPFGFFVKDFESPVFWPCEHGNFGG